MTKPPGGGARAHVITQGGKDREEAPDSHPEGAASFRAGQAASAGNQRPTSSLEWIRPPSAPGWEVDSRQPRLLPDPPKEAPETNG